MITTLRRAPVIRAVLVFLAGCGGGDDGTGVQDSEPVARVEISPHGFELFVGNQATLVVTLFDDAGVQLSGRQISYDSSDPFAVSVSSAGVVSAHREGTARITATSEGRSDFSDVTAGLRPLEPTEDTELQGDSIELKTVVIPLGVTVTVIGDIDLIVQGVIDIAGTLQSDCGKLGLKSSSTVQISGTVQNGCATQGQGDSLKVEADGGLTLDGGTLIEAVPTVVEGS